MILFLVLLDSIGSQNAQLSIHRAKVSNRMLHMLSLHLAYNLARSFERRLEN